MYCPGCTLEMEAQVFPANYGGTVEIDVCGGADLVALGANLLLRALFG